MGLKNDNDTGYDYSRSSVERLSEFVALVEKWNPAVNLISRASAAQLWDRHVWDSARLLDVPGLAGDTWLDIGSGGGFPGIVVAILAKERFPDFRFVLIESDSRKAAFLTQAARLVGSDITIVNDRVERVPPVACDVLSARALAPLSELLSFAERHLKKTGMALFPKGIALEQELATASQNWSFFSEKVPGARVDQGPILNISKIVRL